MSPITREQLAADTHAAGHRLVLAVTGGGSRAIASLVSVPGASRSILAASVPYASEALAEWLGATPAEFCSPRTARAMAMAAFERAKAYAPGDARTVGVACTASLVSDRPKRGPHRVHLAWQSATTTAEASLVLEKGRRTRSTEEDLVCDLVLNQVAEACGIATRLDLELTGQEALQNTRVVAPPEQQDLLADRAQRLPLGEARLDPVPLALFPGAFNPLHDGHRDMARLAREILGCDVAYELSITNVDKPPLDFIEIEARTRQFGPELALWLSRAPLFTQKAELFPRATFVVGADTIARIGQGRYYGSPQAMEEAIAQIASRGCRFLVFGRAADGVFRTLDALEIPESLARLCEQVPESRFHSDISSTELRRQARGQP